MNIVCNRSPCRGNSRKFYKLTGKALTFSACSLYCYSKSRHMNRSQIIREKNKIINLFHEEATFVADEMKAEEFNPLSRFKRREYFRTFDMRLHRQILETIAGRIIKPYCMSPKITIAQFIEYHYPASDKIYSQEQHPTIHQFFKWFCSSATIQNEIDGEKAHLLTLNEPPAPYIPKKCFFPSDISSPG